MELYIKPNNIKSFVRMKQEPIYFIKVKRVKFVKIIAAKR